jgi:hypothetical protein
MSLNNSAVNTEGYLQATDGVTLAGGGEALPTPEVQREPDRSSHVNPDWVYENWSDRPRQKLCNGFLMTLPIGCWRKPTEAERLAAKGADREKSIKVC